MSDYVLTVERLDRNPHYLAPPSSHYAYGRDERTPEQVEFFNTRVLTVTLDDAEYEAVKRGVITSWNAEVKP